jgi:hypothetical protein
MGAPETVGAITPRSHYMRLSTEGGFLTYPCVFPGCITNAISLDSVFMYIYKTRSVWPSDQRLPEKLKNLTDLIDFAWDPLEMHCGSVRSVGSVACFKKLRTLNVSGSDGSIGQ